MTTTEDHPTTHPLARNLPEWSRSREVAALFGVHQRTVERSMSDGKIAFIQPGRRLRLVHRSEIERILAGR
jgi:excisionase family DNA binding protein